MTVAAIEAIRDQLKESARYAASDPGTCGQIIWDQCILLRHLVTEDRRSTIDPTYRLVMRLRDNMLLGRDCLLVDPAVTIAYVYAAVHELGCLKSELERAESDT